ncbi:NAD/NADP octopine/nopaline dehydrogenase family protein [Thiotrichales bacterium 19S3-7]|nr:NAD/NADP octopine/nopaline dehydrogenase family protein [Thiotrichales bacterium 19S3-7]MCF6802183.1 NAD/NADP octopine/nopaline dehydrogenase family protein [Thiotrichales bacterium 19S3-11]
MQVTSNHSVKRIAIIGAGHGGQALAAELALKGHHVNLFADKTHLGGIQAIINNGYKIRLKNKSKTSTAQLHLASTDLAKCVADVEYIFIVLPSFAHESMMMRILPFLENNQKILTLAANFSSLCYLNLIERFHLNCDIILGDIASLPYACRSDNQANVEIVATKNQIEMATIPYDLTASICSDLKGIFPSELIPCHSVLELGLNITSGISHPVNALLNAGRIGKGEKPFYFYKEGISQSTIALIEKLDIDRCLIGERLGFKMRPYLDLMAEFYGTRFASIESFFKNSKAHNTLMLCPDNLQARYISQDIPFVLVPWYSLGILAGYHSEVMQNLIQLASLLNGVDYLKTGRSLNNMQLDHLSVEILKEYALYGKTQQSYVNFISHSMTLTNAA